MHMNYLNQCIIILAVEWAEYNALFAFLSKALHAVVHIAFASLFIAMHVRVCVRVCASFARLYMSISHNSCDKCMLCVCFSVSCYSHNTTKINPHTKLLPIAPIQWDGRWFCLFLGFAFWLCIHFCLRTVCWIY